MLDGKPGGDDGGRYGVLVGLDGGGTVGRGGFVGRGGIQPHIGCIVSGESPIIHPYPAGVFVPIWY